MSFTHLVFLIAIFSPSFLYAEDSASLKKLETLLPRRSTEESKTLDLSGVDMRTYNLCTSDKNQKINLNNANFEGANFSGLKICNVNFEGANLKNANFEGASIISCNFQHTTGPVNFTRASIRYSGFNYANLANSQFTSANLESTGFDYADLRNTNFDQSLLIAVNFYSVDLTGYSCSGAQMERTNFAKSRGTSIFD